MTRLKTPAIACGMLMVCLPAVWAQQQPPPKIKASKKEAQAINDALKATTPDAQLAAIENVLTNFADTQYKEVLLGLAVQDAQQKGDTGLVQTYAERLLEADPKNIFATTALATQIATHTREFDLDKDEKLTKAEKYAKDTLANAPDFPKPIVSNANEQQWSEIKKQQEAEAHIALALVNTIRKNYDGAISEYKASLDLLPDPNTTFRLGDAYLKAGKPDEAQAQFDKVLAMPNASDLVKKYATQEKADAAKMKASANK